MIYSYELNPEPVFFVGYSKMPSATTKQNVYSLYLAVVIDLYSRKTLGWSMSSRMTAMLVCDALTMALWQRRPKAGLIVHSDLGCQYEN